MYASDRYPVTVSVHRSKEKVDFHLRHSLPKPKMTKKTPPEKTAIAANKLAATGNFKQEYMENCLAKQ